MAMAEAWLILARDESQSPAKQIVSWRLESILPISGPLCSKPLQILALTGKNLTSAPVGQRTGPFHSSALSTAVRVEHARVLTASSKLYLNHGQHNFCCSDIYSASPRSPFCGSVVALNIQDPGLRRIASRALTQHQLI